MKKLTLLLFLLSIFLFAAFAVYAQWSCPQNCACTNNTVPVTCFGAVPNDANGDSTAIQNGINSIPDYWTLYFPSGVYLVNQPLNLARSNINLVGDGIQSELKTPQNSTSEPLLSLPYDGYQQGCAGTAYHPTPTNIVIEKLTFNGDMNPGTAACPLICAANKTTGIWIFQGENITIRDVLIEKFGLEGISISNGSVPPKNISLTRLRTQKIRRTAVHFGFGENLTLEDSSLEDEGSDDWLPALVGDPAIDIEVEGLDLECPATSGSYHDPYILNATVKNTLITNPTNTVSKGGIAISPAYGPVRNLTIQDNVLVNTTDISSLGFDGNSQPYGVRDSRVGQSLRIRHLDISSNWISNLHPNQAPYDINTYAASIVKSGDTTDAYGANDVQLNNNVLTVFINGANNRIMEFAGVKELYGSNNKVFRPYYDTTGNVLAGDINFLWNKSLSATNPTNVQITNTVDNGWPGSRLVCYDPSTTPNWDFCSLSGTGNSLTWTNNSNSTPTTPPTITNFFLYQGRFANVTVSEPNNQPVRVMIYQNGLPVGLRTVQGAAGIYLPNRVHSGDTFYIQAFDENGWSGDYSHTAR